METEDLITVAQVAKMWGVRNASVYQAIQSGKLRATEVLGKKAVKKSDAEAYQPRQYRDREGSKAKGGRPQKPQDEQSQKQEKPKGGRIRKQEIEAGADAEA